MPDVDAVAQDYAGEVDVIAVAWRGTYEDTEAAAKSLMPSGTVRWLLDEDQEIFSAFGIAGQPSTVVVAGGVEVDRWFGARGQASLREVMDTLTQY